MKEDVSNVVKEILNEHHQRLLADVKRDYETVGVLVEKNAWNRLTPSEQFQVKLEMQDAAVQAVQTIKMDGFMKDEPIETEDDQ